MKWTDEHTEELACKIAEEYDGDGCIELDNALYELDGCTVVVSASVQGRWRREEETGGWIKESVTASVNVTEVYDDEFRDVDVDLDVLATEVENLIEAA